VGTRDFSVGVKRPGREADTHLHLVPRSKNEWSYNSSPQYAFMVWCSVKNETQGQIYLCLFTFTTKYYLLFPLVQEHKVIFYGIIIVVVVITIIIYVGTIRNLRFP
jgi:hypothetical protein